MGNLKQLASQTFVYGLSSIIGRFLYYFLVPLYTNVFKTSEYGIITELYAYVTFLMILLTYGMETGFFRFSKTEEDKDKVYSTVLICLFVSSLLFLVAGWIFTPYISEVLHYTNHQNYILMFVIILSVDAFVSIPFARLRQQNKALKFAVFKLISIFVNILLNLFFILLLPKLAQNSAFFDSIYSQDFGVGYVFVSNLITSLLSLALFIPDFFSIKFKFDSVLLKRMLLYSLPLVVSGFCGMINEFFDRIAMKFFYTIPAGVADANDYVLSELGIYGANAKIAVLMTLFVQCFRYAADPFFFNHTGEKDFNKLFANTNKYLFAFGLFIFLLVMSSINIVKYFIGSEYWSGLKVVPLLLIGHFIVGLIYLQSFWYKIHNLTLYGILIFVIGTVVTIIVNWLFVPKYGYMACAYANLSCYIVMFLITFFWGRKYIPCQYDYRRIAIYFFTALFCYLMFCFTDSFAMPIKLSCNLLLTLIYCLVVFRCENLGPRLKILISRFKSKI